MVEREFAHRVRPRAASGGSMNRLAKLAVAPK
jgi:hypothetical protein